MLLLAGCGGGSDSESSGSGSGAPPASAAKPAAPKPTGAKSAKLPDFDKDATYNGRTVTDCAAGLADMNPSVQMRALEEISNFGVNGLPVRQQVRAVAGGGNTDELRLAAYAVLFGMKDPEAPALARAALRNPDSFGTPASWGAFTSGAADEIDHTVLIDDMKKLLTDNPEHAERLVALCAGGSGGAAAFSGAPDVRDAAVKAAMGHEKSDATVAAIVNMLPQIDMDDSARVAYIDSNLARLADRSGAMQTLQRIGGDGAFAVALRIINSDERLTLQQKAATIAGFAGVDPATIVTTLGGMAAEPGRGEQDLQVLTGAMTQVPTRLRQQNQEYAGAAAAYTEALTALASSDNVPARGYAVLYLAQGAGNGLIEPMTALGPVFNALRTDDADQVLGTAAQQLGQNIGRMKDMNTEGLAPALAETMFARDADDEWAFSVADGLVQAADAAVRGRVFTYPEIIDAVNAQISAHPGHPADARVLDWYVAIAPNAVRSLGDNVVPFASTIGNLLLDDSVDAAKVEQLVANTNIPGKLAIPGTPPNAATVVAFMEPLLMTGGPRAHAQYTMTTIRQHWLGIGAISGYRDPAQAKVYTDFLQRVVEEGAPEFRLDTLGSVNFFVLNVPNKPIVNFGTFHRDVAGRPFAIKPAYSYAHKAAEFALVETGAPDEAILVGAQQKPNFGRYFGRVDDLKHDYDAVFVDDQGVVVQVGSPKDPALCLTGSYNFQYLTHPTARAVLLIPAGACSVNVGDRMPLEPEFLATL